MVWLEVEDQQVWSLVEEVVAWLEVDRQVWSLVEEVVWLEVVDR